MLALGIFSESASTRAGGQALPDRITSFNNESSRPSKRFAAMQAPMCTGAVHIAVGRPDSMHATSAGGLKLGRRRFEAPTASAA